MTTPATPIPTDEPARLEALSRFDLDTGWADPAFDGLARLAARVCQADVGFFAVVGIDEIRYESAVGMPARTLPREGSPCGWAITSRGLLEVHDVTQDPRFADGPWTAHLPDVRHYAAAVVKSPDGLPLGTVGTLGTAPRQLDAAALRGLEDLADQATALLALRATQPKMREHRRQIRQLSRSLDRAGRALQESRRQFQTLADHAPVLIWMADPSGHRTNFNRSWLDFTGRSLDDNRGLGWLESIHPDDVHDVQERYESACRQQQPFHLEYRFRHHDGQYRAVLDHGVPLVGMRQKHVGFIGSCIDITHQKLFTAQLARAEERLRLALEGGKIGLWDWDLRNDHVFYSETYKRQLGFPADVEWNDFEAWRSRVHPEDLEPALRAVRDYRNGLTAVYHVMFRLQHANGQWRWIRSEGQLLRDRNGEPRRMIGVHIDVTAEKEAEERLKRSEQRLELAIQGTRDGIWDWVVGEPKAWSSSRFKQLLGYREGEVDDHFDWFLDQIHREDIDRVREAMRRHIEEAAPFDVELRLQTKDERYRWFRMRARSVRDPVTGISVRMSGSLEDIHERQQDRERLQHYSDELERSNEELESFAYVASHDLKAPLHGIETLAGFIREDCEHVLPDASREHLEKLFVRVRRMRQLLDDLLAYSRVGRMEGMAQSIETASLVAEVLDTAAAPEGMNLVASGPNLTIETAIAPLRQVLLNLVTNAVKHHDRADGRIEVQTRDSGDWVEFAVCDDGAGIEERYHERIFRMFQTLTPKTGVQGSGMGLAIVKRAVENRGGRVVLESAPGRGSTFRFTWPKCPDGQSPHV